MTGSDRDEPACRKLKEPFVDDRSTDTQLAGDLPFRWQTLVDGKLSREDQPFEALDELPLE